MQSEKAKIDRLTKTLRSFFDTRSKERMSWLNDRLAPKQRKVMISIIQQAKKIDENSL
jgi:hypothetical protein